MPVRRPRLPPWLLGLSNLPLGVSGGLLLLTLPQLLSATRTPEPTIALLTTIFMVPTFIVFLVGPALDAWMSRKAWAILATLGCAVFSALALLLAGTGDLALLAVCLFLSALGAAVNQVASAGWLGSELDARGNSTFGAWVSAANSLGFGSIAMIGVGVIRALPAPWGAVVVSAPILLPLVLYAATEGEPADPRLAHEGFRRLVGDLAALGRRPGIGRLLLMFAAPCASFALTNTLGGLGRDFHASETFVALAGGAAATVAGVFGSLLAAPLARRLPARPLYLGIGAIGGLFTLVLIAIPHAPAAFGLAMVGENIAQSLSLSVVSIIALQSLGENNPLAATQYGLLVCASALPVTYMQYFDGRAYGGGGLAGMLAFDGGLGILACLLIGAVALRGASPARADQPA